MKNGYIFTLFLGVLTLVWCIRYTPLTAVLECATVITCFFYSTPLSPLRCPFFFFFVSAWHQLSHVPLLWKNMLLCRHGADGAPSVQVLDTSSSLRRPLSASSAWTHGSVFERLQRAAPLSLSEPAFAAVVSRAQQEDADCTFTPRINHTHDAALRQWGAGSDVFGRLYGHAQCQQEQRLVSAAALAQEEAENDEAFHQHFRSLVFPCHLYYDGLPSERVKGVPLHTYNRGGRRSSSGQRLRRQLHRSRPSRVASPLLTTSAAYRNIKCFPFGVPMKQHAQDVSFNTISLLSPSAATKAEEQLERMRAARREREA